MGRYHLKDFLLRGQVRVFSAAARLLLLRARLLALLVEHVPTRELAVALFDFLEGFDAISELVLDSRVDLDLQDGLHVAGKDGAQSLGEGRPDS
mmetsp:Transcript_9372/g.14258  ORF Transcript_9372/g.14258 Transcript_9372/m.14258 type:complete len:94 (-) Transcript_9372:1530-1811(-)